MIVSKKHIYNILNVLKKCCVIHKMDYTKKSVPELRALAKRRGHTGYSALRKSQLVGLLKKSPSKRYASVPSTEKQYCVPAHLMRYGTLDIKNGVPSLFKKHATKRAAQQYADRVQARSEGPPMIITWHLGMQRE